MDRDGHRFRVLLNYLRSGTVHVIDGKVPSVNGAVSLEEVLEEARFFGLDNLVAALEEEMNRMQLEESLERMKEDFKKDVTTSDTPLIHVDISEAGERWKCVCDKKADNAILETILLPYQFTLDADF